MIYASWDKECNGHNFLSFWANFCPFTPLLTPKIKICKKCTKSLEILSFLHMCTINENHVMSGSWDARCNRQSFLLFWVIFCPFTPLTIQKIKILKKWKKLLEISWFYTSVSKIMIISYTIPEIWRMTDVIVNFHFGIFFALSVKA